MKLHPEGEWAMGPNHPEGFAPRDEIGSRGFAKIIASRSATTQYYKATNSDVARFSHA